MEMPKLGTRIVATGVVATVILFAAPPAQCSDGNLFSSSLVHDGLTRTYEAYIPQTASTEGERPMLIVLHGGFGDAEKIRSLTRYGFESIADRDGVVVVYPNGIDHHWNDGRTGVNDAAHAENVDDVGFISSLIDTFVRNYGVDSGRVYVTGMSNGAMMAYRLACELTDRIAAIAPVAGAMTDGLANCSPSRPISIVAFNGTADRLVPWQGGQVTVGGYYIGDLVSVPDTLTRWAELNGCGAGRTVTKLPDVDPDDGTRVLESSASCAASTEMDAYAIVGGGHTWPNGAAPTLPISGKVSHDIDGCTVIWDFVKRQARP
jgi:polyhydroxybutyrate depolymerase